MKIALIVSSIILSSFGVSLAQAAETPLLSLNGASFQTKTNGTAFGTDWALWANGYVENNLTVPTTGIYQFQIQAYGDVAQTVWPIMEIRVDNKVVQTLTVSSHSSQGYSFSTRVSAGIRKVDIAFTNDYSGTGGDRNLYVRKLTVVGLVTPGQLVGDMTLPHDSTVYGINPSWDWGSGPHLYVGTNPPSTFDDPHFTPWGIVGSATSGNPAKNVRVQIRKIILDVKRGGAWSRIAYASTGGAIVGSLYTDFETNSSAPANLRQHGDDGISVKLPDGGGTFHFFSSDRFSLPPGAQEIVVRLEARLIVDDPTRADDRSSARILVLSGGDFWKNRTASWSLNPPSNVAFAIGRFKFVTNEWQSFSSSTLSSANEAVNYLASEWALIPR